MRWGRAWCPAHCGAQNVAETCSLPPATSKPPASPPSFPLPCARCPDLTKDPSSNLPLSPASAALAGPCPLSPALLQASKRHQVPRGASSAALGGKLPPPPPSAGMACSAPQTSSRPPAPAQGLLLLEPRGCWASASVMQTSPLTGPLPHRTGSSLRAGPPSSRPIE